MHSAKALSIATLRKEHSLKVVTAKSSLPSAFYQALDKGFAEY